MSTITRTKWTAVEKFTLNHMLRMGKTRAEIADHLQRSEESVKRQILRLAGTKPPKNAKMRDCLRCHQPFPSAGPGNRICKACHNNGSGTAYDPTIRFILNP